MSQSDRCEDMQIQLLVCVERDSRGTRESGKLMGFFLPRCSHTWERAPTRGSVLPLRSIGLILLSFLIRTVGRTPWTGD
jgi:hypothetical protein